MIRTTVLLAALALAGCGAAAEPPPAATNSVEPAASTGGSVPPSLLASLPSEIRSTATSALAGRLARRPLATAAAWDASIPTLRRDKGVAAAWMEVMPGAITHGVDSPCPDLPNACALFREAGTLMKTDTAIRAYLFIVRTEQHGDPREAVRAMVAAQHTPLGEHPALLASYALALDAGGEAMADAARQAGVPADAERLHVQAIKAYPYNPLYWTDLGDHYGRRGEMQRAAALYSVALNLPSPGAQPGSRSPVLQSKADFLKQLMIRSGGDAARAAEAL